MGQKAIVFFARKKDILIYLLFLNLISNLAGSFIHKGFIPFIQMVMLSFSSSLIEYFIIRLSRPKILKKAFLAIFILFHNLLIILDYFLIFKFQNIICQEVIDILSETNKIEISNFIHTYIQPGTILLWLFCITFFNYLLYRIAKWLPFHSFFGVLFLFFSSFGLIIWCIMTYNYVFYRNGMNIPQYHSATRLSYSCLILKERIEEIHALRIIANEYSAQPSALPPNIVVIIGESSSIFHSQLYGYEKPTSPLLSERKHKGEIRKLKGEIAVYNNVVSIDDHTHGAMMSVFSLSSFNESFTEKPIFPICFKRAGYHTALFDNQYFVGSGINFLSDQGLSELMFDKRNTRRYSYDGEMVKSTPSLREPYLFVLHLWGQHYTYSERYPKAFNHFKASDYDKTKYTLSQRKIIAHYDNATLYNDFVINEIIRKYENDDCCIIYFSDHGEEIYDYRDFMGHGNAAHASDINFQIRVPLIIWVSEKYKKNRPEKANMMLKNIMKPVSTDDMPHILLDIADIKCEDFSPSRSVINKSYSIKHRIVLHTIDYDSLK